MKILDNEDKEFNEIIILGAKEHNLKNIDLIIPRDKLTVITGLSGSGKSSLAFDTLYAEGQRRYVETMSSYAKQFIGMLKKPDVDKQLCKLLGTPKNNYYQKVMFNYNIQQDNKKNELD